MLEYIEEKNEKLVIYFRYQLQSFLVYFIKCVKNGESVKNILNFNFGRSSPLTTFKNNIFVRFCLLIYCNKVTFEKVSYTIKE